MSYMKFKIAALGLTLIGGVASIAANFAETFKTEAQIDEEIERRFAERFPKEEETDEKEEES